MAKVCSTMLVLVLACLVANVSLAQEKKRGKGDRPSPEKRFDDMEKAVKHDPLKGELTKEEFVTAMKQTAPPQFADKAEEFFKRIKKADENKVTKDEYVKGMKELFEKMKQRGKKPEKQ